MNKYISTEKLYEIFISCGQKICTDTRNLERGAIFFALKGESFDANKFAERSIESGCAFAIVDDETISNNQTILLVKDSLDALQQLAKFHRKQLVIPIIGITGSNGKTTNKELIYSVLSMKYKTFATRGNLNNHIGVPLTLLKITQQHEIAIVEMGANHQGEIAFLCDLADPDYGLITNIGKAHLEGFGGMEGVKIGKTELYKHIEQRKGEIFINGNDEVLIDLSSNLSKIYYGENNNFDVYGILSHDSEFVQFKWNIKGRDLEGQPLLKTNMYGEYNFINFLCAACIGHYFKVGETEINRALENYLPEMNRSQIKNTEFNSLILDAYNANPSSMALAVTNFQNQPFQNKVMILGDMLELGVYSQSEHEKILNIVLDSKFQSVFLIGVLFLKFKNQFPKYHFFETVTEFREFVSVNKINGCTVLVKGSRGIQLEKVVDFL